MLGTEFLNKEFVITSVTRADLVAAGFPKESVEQIDDEDMQKIASVMEDLYCDHGYWEDVQTAVNRVVIAILIPPDESTGEQDGLT